jgi:alkanesulfonate monooxygenase SsuD/methylene tetrahydromethanopterin reductase-like flavin-dependent oxidoreductase (luciferase family)
VKRLGHTTDFDGNYYHLKGARNEPKGPQRAYYGSPRYAQH